MKFMKLTPKVQDVMQLTRLYQVFDVYPDGMNEGNGFDIFPWPPASPFGYNGRYLYTRLELTGR